MEDNRSSEAGAMLTHRTAPAVFMIAGLLAFLGSYVQKRQEQPPAERKGD